MYLGFNVPSSLRDGSLCYLNLYRSRKCDVSYKLKKFEINMLCKELDKVGGFIKYN